MINVIGWIILGGIFSLVSVVSTVALRRHSIFGNGSSVVVGGVVGLLSATGLYREFAASAPPVAPTGSHRGFKWILVPLSTLSLAVLAVLLALLSFRTWKWFLSVAQYLRAWIARPTPRAFPEDRGDEHRRDRREESNPSWHAKNEASRAGGRKRGASGSEWRKR